MYRTSTLFCPRPGSRVTSISFRRALSKSPMIHSSCSGKNTSSEESTSAKSSCKSASPAPGGRASILTTNFWRHRPAWKRAGLNTLRCLVGCTLGDFSSLWLLQSYYPELGMTPIMVISSKSMDLSPRGTCY